MVYNCAVASGVNCLNDNLVGLHKTALGCNGSGCNWKRTPVCITVRSGAVEAGSAKLDQIQTKQSFPHLISRQRDYEVGGASDVTERERQSTTMRMQLGGSRRMRRWGGYD